MAAEIKKEILSLPCDKPTSCEEQIRKIHKKIECLEDQKEKANLLSELETSASYGLSNELREILEKKGLAQEFAIVLVLKYLTNLPELAEYLYLNKDDQLNVLRRRVGQEVELLGALKAEGVNIEKKWVKNLCKKAPSLKSLRLLSCKEKQEICKEASKEELDTITKLETTAATEAHVSCPTSTHNQAQTQDQKKAEEKEKLNKAKELLDEAKTMAVSSSNENQTEIKKQLSKILKVLEMPTDWYKQDIVPPEELLKQLDEIIQQHNFVIDACESYGSDLEVVAKASGGLVCHGVYYSEYEPTTKAGLPILTKPTNVESFNPTQSVDIKYQKFARQGAAAEYVTEVERSGTETGFGIKGFYYPIVGEAEGAYGSEAENQSNCTTKSSTTSVSVLESRAITMKEYRVNEEHINVCSSAKESALQIRTHDDARSYMERYGSHFPAGVHKVGGIFYSIADAETQNSIEMTKFTGMAVERLKGEVSVGFVGGFFGGGSFRANNNSNSGRTTGNHSEEKNTTYTFSVKAIGPPATNPATFQRLLSNNSTWAIIDRGSRESFIPVWELLRRQGREYNSAAHLLEKTWKKDESDRKQVQEAPQKNKEKRQIEEEASKKMKKMKQDHLNCWERSGPSYRPKNGTMVFQAIFKGITANSEAYNSAMNFVEEDLEHNICHMKFYQDSMGVQCCQIEHYIAPSDTAMEFEKTDGDHIFFFSEMCFMWKDIVQKRTLIHRDVFSVLWFHVTVVVQALLQYAPRGRSRPNDLG